MIEAMKDWLDGIDWVSVAAVFVIAAVGGAAGGAAALALLFWV